MLVILQKKMINYLNKNRNSNVLAYSLTDTSISVVFKDQKYVYVYNENKPGITKVERMKKYAVSGEGLNEYIKKEIGGNYAAKKQLKKN
jgi:hypothetical protein